MTFKNWCFMSYVCSLTFFNAMNEWIKWLLIYRLSSGQWPDLKAVHSTYHRLSDGLPTWVEQSKDTYSWSTSSFPTIIYSGSIIVKFVKNLILMNMFFRMQEDCGQYSNIYVPCKNNSRVDGRLITIVSSNDYHNCTRSKQIRIVICPITRKLINTYSADQGFWKYMIG